MYSIRETWLFSIFKNTSSRHLLLLNPSWEEEKETPLKHQMWTQEPFIDILNAWHCTYTPSLVSEEFVRSVCVFYVRINYRGDRVLQTTKWNTPSGIHTVASWHIVEEPVAIKLARQGWVGEVLYKVRGVEPGSVWCDVMWERMQRNTKHSHTATDSPVTIRQLEYMWWWLIYCYGRSNYFSVTYERWSEYLRSY